MTQYKGQCACGAIKYSCNSDPKFTLMCQCRECQRITGAGHSVQFAMSAQDTTLEGQLSSFEYKADSGNSVKSMFCGGCGNPIYKTTSMMPDMMVFHAATLDDPGVFKAQMVVHSSSAQPWDYIDPSLDRK